MSATYVLITAARNEAANIEKTLLAVISQTILPLKWVIVSDGSTDKTDEIIQRYASRYPFIVLERLNFPPEARNFAAKVRALQNAYAHLLNTPSDFIGNVDADISFSSSYYEKLLQYFRQNSRLGVAGGLIHDLQGKRFIPQNTSLNSVSGAVQFFRRICYHTIGGYLPLYHGAEDAAAEIMARMNGWQVATIPQLKVYHHGRVGVKTGNILQARIRDGKRFYALGYHPMFYLLRSIYRIIDRPFLIGSLIQLLTYWKAYLSFEKQPVPPELIHYLRAEQAARMRTMFRMNSEEAPVSTTRLSFKKN